MIKKILIVTSTLLLFTPVVLYAYGTQTTDEATQKKIELSERTDCYDMCEKHLYPEADTQEEDTNSCIPEITNEYEKTSCYDMCTEHLNR